MGVQIVLHWIGGVINRREGLGGCSRDRLLLLTTQFTD